MAGPFALPGNTAQDIASAQVAPGVADTPAQESNDGLRLAEAATKAVKTVGALNLKRLETEATMGVQEDIKAVRDALQINKHPNLAQAYFSEESLQDPYIQEVYNRFNEIQGAVSQGRLPQEYGLERMEAVMSEAVSRRPQFADAIRKTANDTAGANISSKIFSQIMKASPQQAAWSALEQEAARVGLPVETVQGYAQQQFLRDQENALLQQKKTRGTFTANDMANQIRGGVRSVTLNVQSEMLAEIKAGGIEDPAIYKAAIRQQFTGLRGMLLADLPNTVDATLVNANISTLDTEEQRLLAMVDDGSMVKLLENGRNIYTELAHEDIRNSDSDVTKLFYLLGGGQAGMEAMNMYTKYKTNPEAFQGMFQLEQGGALTLGLMLDQTDKAAKIMRGEVAPETEQEKRLAGFLSGLRMKHDTAESNEKAPTPQEAARLVDVISNAGEEYSTITLSDSRIAQGIKGYKDVHPQVINHFTSDEASLNIKYNQLKAKGIISDDLIVLRNGTLQLDDEKRLDTAGVGNFGLGGTTNSGELGNFLRQANQTLKMGRVYKSNGVFPDTVFKDGTFFMNSLKAGVQEGSPKPVEQEVISVTINPDGTYNFDGGL